jgi:hypothetical protein
MEFGGEIGGGEEVNKTWFISDIFNCRTFLIMKKILLAAALFFVNGLAYGQQATVVSHGLFDYLKLFLENGVSVLLFTLVVWLLVKRPELLDRITSFGAFGVSVQLDKIKESVEATQKDVVNLKNQFAGLSEEYKKTADTFDPNSSATERDKLAVDLKRQAGAIEDVTPYLSALNLQALEADVFGAAIIFRKHPTPKCFMPIVNYLNAIGETKNLNKLTLKTIYRVIMVIGEVVRADNARAERVLSEQDRKEATQAITKIKLTERAQADDRANGKKSIVALIDRTVKTLEAKAK